MSHNYNTTNLPMTLWFVPNKHRQRLHDAIWNEISIWMCFGLDQSCMSDKDLTPGYICMLLEVAKCVSTDIFLHFDLSCSSCECNDPGPQFRGLVPGQLYWWWVHKGSKHYWTNADQLLWCYITIMAPSNYLNQSWPSSMPHISVVAPDLYLNRPWPSSVPIYPWWPQIITWTNTDQVLYPFIQDSAIPLPEQIPTKFYDHIRPRQYHAITWANADHALWPIYLWWHQAITWTNFYLVMCPIYPWQRQSITWPSSMNPYTNGGMRPSLESMLTQFYESICLW